MENMYQLSTTRCQSACIGLSDLDKCLSLDLYFSIDVENDWIANSTSRPLCDVVYVAPRMREMIDAHGASGNQSDTL